MNKFQVIVIGGGPAGVAACCELASKGIQVALVDQFQMLGGVVYRHAFEQNDCSLVANSIAKQWKELKRRLDKHKNNISLFLNTTFLGVDSTGVVMLENRQDNSTHYFKPEAIIIATGAIEKVSPFPGWNLPGIITAGGLQVSLKSSGIAPQGDIILSGNGPLLLAIAAQLVKLGSPPIAIIESGQPLKPRFLPFKLPINYFYEGTGYIYNIAKSGIPIYSSSVIKNIINVDNRLELTLLNKTGIESKITTNFLALHNGLTPNSFGLPKENIIYSSGLIVKYAGDCKQIIGSVGAVFHGVAIANEVYNCMLKIEREPLDSSYQRHLLAQQILNQIYQPQVNVALKSLPSDTMACRCEQKTIGDLKKFCSRTNITAKEIKLNGRFTMGRCQGRFCESTVKAMMDEYGIDPINQTLSSNSRWPVKPTRIKSLAKLQSK